MKEENLVMARKFLSAHQDDEKLMAFMGRTRRSEFNYSARHHIIREYIKANYSPSMSIDLIDGLVQWSLME